MRDLSKFLFAHSFILPRGFPGTGRVGGAYLIHMGSSFPRGLPLFMARSSAQFIHFQPSLDGEIVVGYHRRSDWQTMTEQPPTREQLIKDFEEDEDACFDSGRTNNVVDIALTIISVLGSLVATVLAATVKNPALVASVAAVPAACTSLQRIVGFRGRSVWYFQHAASLKALKFKLKYAVSPNLEEFAEERAELELTGEQRWEQVVAGKDTPEGRARRKAK